MSIKHRIVLPMSMEEEYKNADVPGPSDLEEVIKRLEFRNEKLHKYIDQLIDENNKLRRLSKDGSKLEINCVWPDRERSG
jgi:hypothetical protein